MSTPATCRSCLHSLHNYRQHLLQMATGSTCSKLRLGRIQPVALPSPCLSATSAEPQGTAQENFLIGLPTERLPPHQAVCLDPSPSSSTDLHDTAQRPYIRLRPMALSQQHFWGQVVGGPTYCPVGQNTRSVHALHHLTDSLPPAPSSGIQLTALSTPFCSLWPKAALHLPVVLYRLPPLQLTGVSSSCSWGAVGKSLSQS